MIVSALFAAPAFPRFLPKLASQVYLLAIPPLLLGVIETKAHFRAAMLAWLAGTAVVIVLAVSSVIGCSTKIRTCSVPTLR